MPRPATIAASCDSPTDRATLSTQKTCLSSLAAATSQSCVRLPTANGCLRDFALRGCIVAFSDGFVFGFSSVDTIAPPPPAADCCCSCWLRSRCRVFCFFRLDAPDSQSPSSSSWDSADVVDMSASWCSARIADGRVFLAVTTVRAAICDHGRSQKISVRGAVGGQRAGQGGQAYGQGHLYFFIRGWAGTHLISAECTTKWNLHLTLPASGKILLFRARAVPHLCIFGDRKEFRERSERKKILDPITPGVHLRHNYFQFCESKRL